MNKINRILCFVFIQTLFLTYTWAEIHLPNVFTDHMVLQRNSKVTVWGWGTPGETITIVPEWLNGDTLKVQASNMGKWSARIRTGEAGGPYKIRFSGSSEVTLSDVMLGEVWLCSGQSNMEWCANYGIKNGEEEIRKADYPNLRIFLLPRLGASTPQENCFAKWETCTPESMRKASAIGYFFGRNISEELNVPVGIIVSAWGGTPAEIWTPRESIMSDPVLADYSYEVTPWWPVEPGCLYNNMIHPVIPYEIAGCIWYQGESNHSRANSYARLMQRLISSWRTAFNKEFPFYLVQIAPFKYHSKDNGPALLREQQAMLPKMMHKVKMVTVSDLVDDPSDIHPRNKRDAGLRLARLALDDTYGKFTGEYASPAFKAAQLKDDKVIISFDEVKKGLKIHGERIIGLKIAGADMQWKDADAKVKGNELIVSASGLKSPVSIRYCFDDDSIGNLFSIEGMPVGAFRTEEVSMDK